MNNASIGPIAPDLAAQLVDPRDATLSAGSNIKVHWRCDKDPRHVWEASPNTRRKSPACPVCLNKKIIAGVNDLATTHPDIAAQLTDPAQATVLHAGSHSKVSWTCDKDLRHVWTASVVSRIRSGAGCPYCSGRIPVPGVNDLATTHPEIAARLVEPDLATTVGAGSSKKLMWICPENPDHTWLAPVRNITGVSRAKPTGCPHCLGRENRTGTKYRPTLGKLESPVLADAVNPERVAKLTEGSGVVVEWHCRTCPEPHTYSMSVRKKLAGQDCPVMSGKTIIAGINDLATTHPEIASRFNPPYDPTKTSRGSVAFVDVRCDDGHVHRSPVYALVAGNGCPKCSPTGSSHGEKQIHEVVATLCGGTDKVSHRMKIDVEGEKIEIDVAVGDLAIEFNGLYWHSEAHRANNHHRDKTAALARAGYRLLTVWEDQWNDPGTRAVTICSIAHRIGRREHLAEAFAVAGIADRYDPAMAETHGARTLKSIVLDGREAAAFFRDNHLQGATALTRTWALVDADGRVRAALGARNAGHNARLNRDPGQWDIQRYATCGHVPGGFGKLLAAATADIRATFGPDAITGWVTISALDYSNGGLYRACGFVEDRIIAPNYWYTGGPVRGARASKESFQLKRFTEDPTLTYEPGWTEHAAALANGLLRVYDSGKIRWIKDV